VINRSFVAAGLLLAIASMTGGCVSYALTKAVVQAPNQREVPRLLRPQNVSRLARYDQTYASAWTVHVASPPADIAVAVVEPGDYSLVHDIKSERRKDGRTHFWPQSDWTVPAKTAPAAVPKATVLVLHGFQDTKEDMMHWALFLAQAGYRIVLVDLRGHGRSTGDWIGYGAFEVNDLKNVLDEVQRRGLITGPIGVVGLSYGASVALQLAGHDPRVGSVVAIEPFSDPRRAVVEFAHGVVPKLVKDWTAEDFSNAEDRAGRMAHFSWLEADVIGSVERTTAPIAFICAENDHWISPENTKALAAKTQSVHGVATVKFDDPPVEPHVLLSWILDPIAPNVVKWLDETLLHPGPDLNDRLKKLGLTE
jgi:pimeloyl-ACP methyl ester carboxylesterase